jgi:pimeloyl-ACP methyl ester carboxylesterase
MEEGVTGSTIVLVHGLAIIRPASVMFTGVAPALEAKGYRVVRTLVQGDGTIDGLANRLWEQLAAIDGPLTLVCHSMGGLQARALLLDDNRARRIRAIATLGTPHLGTPLTHVVAPFQHAYRDMTPDARTAWTATNGEREVASAKRHGVRCISAVASVVGAPRHSQLRIPHAVLKRMDGASDGLVPSRSQRWGEHVFEVDLDHIECAELHPRASRARSSIETWVRLGEIACQETVHPPSTTNVEPVT